MSGGALTDYRHNLYQLKEWACRIRPENPLLAEMMNDLYDLLGEYDMYISGDAGRDPVGRAWDGFRGKWMFRSEDEWRDDLIARAKAEAISYIDRVGLGYDPESE